MQDFLHRWRSGISRFAGRHQQYIGSHSSWTPSSWGSMRLTTCMSPIHRWGTGWPGAADCSAIGGIGRRPGRSWPPFRCSRWFPVARES